MKIVKQKLSSSSSTVLIFSKKYYEQFEQTKNFLESLELSEGRSFCDEILKIWPHYTVIIENRKIGIHNTLKEILKK